MKNVFKAFHTEKHTGSLKSLMSEEVISIDKYEEIQRKRRMARSKIDSMNDEKYYEQNSHSHKRSNTLRRQY